MPMVFLSRVQRGVGRVGVAARADSDSACQQASHYALRSNRSAGAGCGKDVDIVPLVRSADVRQEAAVQRADAGGARGGRRGNAWPRDERLQAAPVEEVARFCGRE